jgi:hypothetical protein
MTIIGAVGILLVALLMAAWLSPRAARELACILMARATSLEASRRINKQCRSAYRRRMKLA